MASSILSGAQPFSLQSDTGVHWNANASSSTAGLGAANQGYKKHITGSVERSMRNPPQSYDAITGGRSTPDYSKAYGNS